MIVRVNIKPLPFNIQFKEAHDLIREMYEALQADRQEEFTQRVRTIAGILYHPEPVPDADTVHVNIPIG